jgi:hypothetical protein
MHVRMYGKFNTRGGPHVTSQECMHTVCCGCGVFFQFLGVLEKIFRVCGPVQVEHGRHCAARVTDTTDDFDTHWLRQRYCTFLA